MADSIDKCSCVVGVFLALCSLLYRYISSVEALGQCSSLEGNGTRGGLLAWLRQSARIELGASVANTFATDVQLHAAIDLFQVWWVYVLLVCFLHCFWVHFCFLVISVFGHGCQHCFCRAISTCYGCGQCRLVVFDAHVWPLYCTRLQQRLIFGLRGCTPVWWHIDCGVKQMVRCSP
jgi:hypothetical protein